MEKTDLTFIATEDLTDELNNRFDGLIIMAIQDKTAKEQDTYYHRYKGGMARCMGLAEILKNIIMDDYNEGRPKDIPER